MKLLDLGRSCTHVCSHALAEDLLRRGSGVGGVGGGGVKPVRRAIFLARR